MTKMTKMTKTPKKNFIYYNNVYKLKEISESDAILEIL